MDIRVLRYFLMVAQEESFSRAAERLFLSQPTLSRQIHELETELGVTLLKRTNRNVILTSDGQRLRKRAQEIVELADKTRQEFAVPTARSPVTSISAAAKRTSCAILRRPPSPCAANIRIFAFICTAATRTTF